MRILQVVAGRHGVSGGTLSQTRILMEGLRGRGHDLSLVCPPESPLGETMERSGFRVHRLKMRSEADLVGGWGLAGILRRGGYDLVNAQTPTAHAMSMMATAFRRRPLVVHKRFYWKRLNWFSAHLKYGGWIDRIAVPSAAVRDHLIACGVRPDLVTVLHDGIDPERFRPGPDGAKVRREFGIPEKAPLVGSVGDGGFFKGYYFFARSLALLLRDRPDLRWLAVGVGRSDVRFVRFLEEAGVADRVVLAGYRRDMPEVYAALDLFVFPSIVDALPNAVIEAQAMELPVVANRIGGVPEIVEEGTTGLLAPPWPREKIPAEERFFREQCAWHGVDGADPGALAERVEWMLAHPAQAQAMGKAGRRRMLGEFTQERMIERTESLYREVLGGHGA